MRNSKIPSILESSWNYLELWNSSGYGLFFAEFDKMGIKSIKYNDFAHYWEHLMIFETLNPDIQITWNPWIWLVFADYNQQGIFPTQFLSLISIFNVKFQNSIPGIIQNFGIPLVNNLFLPFSTKRVFFPWNFWP